MTPRRTMATARRVLAQLRHDKRTIALMLVVPVVLISLLKWVLDATPGAFNSVGLSLLGIFPFVSMFLITSVATLRERKSGTLERLLAMPLGKADLVFGYQIAFGTFAVLQALIATSVTVWGLGLKVIGPTWAVVLVAVVVAELGTAMGLFISAFAETEFQAVQFMPAMVLPQFLLCGLLADRQAMTTPLRWLSDVLPLSYAVDAMQRISTQTYVSRATWLDLGVVLAFVLSSLLLGAVTLRRRTD
ncbi:MAG: ABC transporter permease [Actinomycetes bacterium]